MAPDDEDGLDDDRTVLGESVEEVNTALLRKDRPYLIIIAGTQVGEMFLVEADTVLGRGLDVQVRIAEDKLSRKHCRFVIEGGDTIVEDLGSSNGTYINGVRVVRKKLSDGDKIQVGATTILKFTYHDQLEEDFQKQMYDSALRDGLTKVFNKKYFQDRMRSEFAFTTRHRTPLSLILFDIDHFKKVNDTRGHLAGDKVLVQLAAHIVKLLRTEDVLARYGGEEFAILCRNTDVHNASILAERVRATTASLEIHFNEAMIPITISLGVAMIPDPGITDVDGLVRVTDEALYEAKRGGRNRVVARKRG